MEPLFNFLRCLGALLALLAITATMDPAYRQSTTEDSFEASVIHAVFFCASVFFLQWFIWRWCIPKRGEDAARLGLKPNQDYISRSGAGVQAFGNLMLIGAGLERVLRSPRDSSPPDFVFYFGAFLIVVGFACRARTVIEQLTIRLARNQAFENARRSDEHPSA